jgi:hypothetical protein
MNNRPVAPWDPFFSSSGLTTLLPGEEWLIDGQTIRVRPYILPHPNKLTPQELAELGDDRGWHDLQGFYVFRNRRLIIAGEWLLPRLEKKDIFRLARIRIDISSENDSGWNIDIKKSTAMPPISVHDDLRRIARLSRDRSSLIFQHRGKIIGRTPTTDEDFIWHQYVKNGKIGYAINRNHPLIRRFTEQDKTKSAETLFKYIEETIPVPAIIAGHAENPDQMLAPYEGEDGSNYSRKLEAAYNLFTGDLNLSPEEAVERLAHTEPFVYWEAALGSLCAKLGISNPSKPGTVSGKGS